VLPYDEAGSGRPVVLLHAGIADRGMWAEHLQPLADAGFRAIAVDLPGFGDAPVTPGEQAPWNDVLATMNELGLERAALVGNSFGAAVALRVAAVAPDRVEALVLASAPAPGMEPGPELSAAWQAEEDALEAGDVDAAVRAVVEAWAPPKLHERVGAMQRRAFEVQLAAGAVSEAPDPVEEDPAVLERLDVPALVTVGEREFPDFRDGAEALARLLPRARLEILPTGHLSPLEAPEAFCALVVEFLQRA